MGSFASSRSVGGLLVFVLVLLAAGCGGSGTAPPLGQAPGTGSFALFGQDLPLDNLVKFEITVSSVVLNPGNVSVLPQPVRLELTSLQMTTDLLRLERGISPSGFTGVDLTFANPEIKFRDPSTGNIVEVFPTLQTSSVSVNVSFSVVANQITALLFDFNLRAMVVTDAAGNITGVNPTSSNITISLVDVAGDVGEFEDEVGRVVSVDTTTFDFEPFSSCQVVTITTDISTVFEDFGKATPPLADVFLSLQAEQIVEVDADLRVDGTFLAEKVEFEDDALEDEIEGLIVDVTRTGGNVTQFQLVLFDVAPCAATLPVADIFTVNVPTTAGSVRFRIDEDDLTVDPALFDDPGDLEVGQKVDVDPVEALGTTTTLTAEKIKLEDQTIRGTVNSTTGTTFLLNPAADLFPDQEILVETNVDTRFDDLSLGVGSLSSGDLVRVKGLLFRIGTNELKLVAKRVDGTP